MCSKGCSGRGSRWEPGRGLWTICQQTGKRLQALGSMRSVRGKGRLTKKALSVLHWESHAWFLLSPPSLGVPLLSPLCIYVSAAPGFPLSFWHCQSLLVSISQFLVLLVSFLGLCVCCIPPSFHVIFLVWVSAVWLTSLLSPSQNIPKLRGCQLSFFPGKPTKIPASRSVPLWASTCWLAELLLAGIGSDTSFKACLGQEKACPGWSSSGCHLSPFASSQCRAEAVKPQAPPLLRAKLGAQSDVCSRLGWERSFRTSKLWFTLAGEQEFTVFVILVQRRGVSI